MMYVPKEMNKTQSEERSQISCKLATVPLHDTNTETPNWIA